MFRHVTKARTLVPALLASVAYVDPGNFGVNIAAGVLHGYALVWVVIAASVVAALVQYLSATLGLASGWSLAEACRERYGTPVRLLMWLQAMLVVVMTDLAEIMGGALALHLLFGCPLTLGAVIVAAIAFVATGLREGGATTFEAVALALLGAVGISVAALLTQLSIQMPALARGLAPSPMDGSAVMFAVGIVGATVMPHALYLHSALSAPRAARDRRHPPMPHPAHDGPAAGRRAIRSIAIAMGLAGLANVSLILVGAAVGGGTDDLVSVFHRLGVQAGPSAAMFLGVALLASGLASTIVGLRTGELVMSGFLKRSFPVLLRRALGAIPPVALLAFGMDPTTALVLSQVVLSLALPVVLIPLVRLTAEASVMGPMVTRGPMLTAAVAATALVVMLNGFLVWTWVLPGNG